MRNNFSVFHDTQQTTKKMQIKFLLESTQKNPKIKSYQVAYYITCLICLVIDNNLSLTHTHYWCL